MSRYSVNRYLTPVSCVLLIVILWGCRRPAAENAADPAEHVETSAAEAGTSVTTPEKPGETTVPTTAVATPGVTAPGVVLAAAHASSAKVDFPTVVPIPTAISSIGPGNFNGSRETIVSRTAGVRSLVLAPDGRFVAIARQVSQTSGALQIWDAATARLISETFEPQGVTAVAFAPDSQTVAYGAGDRSLVLQPMRTGPAKRWHGHRLFIVDLAYSMDGKQLASIGFDKQLILWDVSRGAMVAEAVAADSRVASRIRFASPDQLWTWTEGGTLRWYGIQANSLTLSKELKVSGNLWPALTDGMKLYGIQKSDALRVVDVSTGLDLPSPLPETAQDHDATEGPVGGAITAMAIATASRDVAVCSADGKLTLWEQGNPTAKRSWDLGMGVVARLASDDQGRVWAAQTVGDGLLVFNRDRPEVPRWLEKPTVEITRTLLASRFSALGDTVVIAPNSETVVLSQIATGQARHRMSVPDASAANGVSVLLAGRDDVVIYGTKSGDVGFGKAGVKMPTSVSLGKTAISALAETPDGKHLLAGDVDGAITWIDPQGKSSPIQRREQKGRIGAVEVSPDGRWAATASADHSVVLWDIAQRSRVLALAGHSHPVQAVEFAADSRSLATGDETGIIILWDIPAGSQKWSVTVSPTFSQSRNRSRALPSDSVQDVTSQIQTQSTVVANASQPTQGKVAPADAKSSPATSPQSPVAAKASADSSTAGTSTARTLAADTLTTGTSTVDNRVDTVVPINPGAAATPSSFFNRGVSTLAFSLDQRVLAVGTATGYTQTFDLMQRRELATVFHPTAICDLAFASDGASLLVATLSGDVTRWWRAPALPRMLSGHQGSTRFVALDATGQRAVTGGQDKRLCVWDAGQGTLLSSLDNAGEVITTGALSPDGRRAVTGSFGSGVVFWDLVSLQRLTKRYGHGKRIQSLAMTQDGQSVASGSEDQTVRVWDFATQKTKLTIPHGAPVHFVTFSPDGTKLLTSTIDPRGWQFASRLRLWDTSTGKLLSELQGHQVAVNAGVFSPDGSQLTTCGADGHLCRWNVSTSQRIQESFRSDGLSHAGLINGGRLLVLRRFNKGIIIQPVDSHVRWAEFDVPTRSVGDLNVASRGDRIIAGTEEGPVYVWSIGHE